MRTKSILRRLRVPSHASLAAYLALFLALSGGTAVALKGKNTIFSDDIRDGQVKGADVDEGSLGQVPSAASAGTATSATSAGTANTAGTAANADSLGGVSASQIPVGGGRVLSAYAEQAAGTTPAPILTLPGIGHLRGRCDDTPADAVLDFQNTSGQALRYWVDDGGADPGTAQIVTSGANSADTSATDDDDMLVFQISSENADDPVKVATVTVSIHEHAVVGDIRCQYAWQGLSFPRS
jgi:hypothetical protein